MRKKSQKTLVGDEEARQARKGIQRTIMQATIRVTGAGSCQRALEAQGREVIFTHQFSSVMDKGLVGVGVVRDCDSLTFPVCHMDRQGKLWCPEKLLWQKDGSWTLVPWTLTWSSPRGK